MQNTEVRTRIPSGATMGRDAEVVYLAVYTADGKRRILRDNLGTLRVTAEGWQLDIPESALSAEYPTRDEAMSTAKAALEGS